MRSPFLACEGCLLTVSSHWVVGGGQDKFKLSMFLSCYCCLVTKSCLTLCDSMDHSPPDFSVNGISQARILEWIVISFSRESSSLRDQTHISYTGRWILYHRGTTEALFLSIRALIPS